MRMSFSLDDSNPPRISSSRLRNAHETPTIPHSKLRFHNDGSNVFQLLAHREVSPQTKCSARNFWRVSPKFRAKCSGFKYRAAIDARQGLISWVETESFYHLSAKHCPLLPTPRSTIAAAFSPDGKTLASTHGDHTVKIIDCQTGRCLKVLTGHQRTPWVVSFHPVISEILASGSLDHEVRFWNANTSECIGSHVFSRPIASIAFHAQGEILAVASGHKLYMWCYNGKGNTSSPAIVLKTCRSLRAVHFHPNAAPLLLTAEVNDLDLSDTSMTLATLPGHLYYPPPSVYVADTNSIHQFNSSRELPLMSLPFFICPTFGRDDGRAHLLHLESGFSSTGVQQRVDSHASVRLLTYSTPSGQYELLLSPVGCNDSHIPQEHNNPLMTEFENFGSQSTTNAMDLDSQVEERSSHAFFFGNQTSWELPFLQGWLIGQSQAGQRSINNFNGVTFEDSSVVSEVENPASGVPTMIPTNISRSRVAVRSTSYYHSHSRVISSTESFGHTSFRNAQHDNSYSQPMIGDIQSEFSTSLAAATAAELPCTVNLRLWSHDIEDPYKPLDTGQCRLSISHAVLCSEMGAHFSPCGRFLAACVACLLPNMEADHSFHGNTHHDATGSSTSPTRHPISQQVMFELRIYSLEDKTFGSVLASRAIRAAHCLTSIQFSPTSKHLLLAYGRRHGSLLKSILLDGETTVPIYTIIEVYRVSDMELVRVIPSAEDEVNVACFHPSVGGGLAYGTKEGKVRILQYDSCCSSNSTPSSSTDENMIEGP